MVKSDGISPGTDGQISRHVFRFSTHERASRHVKIGPDWLVVIGRIEMRNNNANHSAQERRVSLCSCCIGFINRCSLKLIIYGTV